MTAFFDSPALMIITVGALVGTASSLVGTFLVLRRTSLLSDAISHSVLLGIVLMFLVVEWLESSFGWHLGGMHSPLILIGAALAGLLTVFLTELLTRSRLVKADAAIGLVFPALFALAVLLINLFLEDVHLDQDAVLLGAIEFCWLDVVEIGDQLVPTSMLVMGVIALLNLAFVVALFKELKLSTFDSGLAAALGFAPGLVHYGLLSLTSITAVGAFDAVGAILVIAFIIVPASAAYLLTDDLRAMLAIAIAIAIASSATGYWVAVQWNVSVSGMMATMTGVFFVAALLLGPRYGLIARSLRRRRQRFEYAARALTVHLFNHETTSEVRTENRVDALEGHLRWTQMKSDRVVNRCQQQGLVRLDREFLSLTEKGRDMAERTLANDL